MIGGVMILTMLLAGGVVAWYLIWGRDEDRDLAERAARRAQPGTPDSEGHIDFVDPDDACPICEGAGWGVRGSQQVPCPGCHGYGTLEMWRLFNAEENGHEDPPFRW